MVKATELILVGGLAFGAYWLLTKGNTALAAGGGTVAEELVSGVGEVSAGLLQGAAQGGQEFIFNIQEAGAELGEKNANDIMKLLDQAGFYDTLKEQTENSTLWTVGQTEQGLKQIVPVPRPGYTSKTAMALPGGGMVTILNGKRVDEMNEQEFYNWKAEAGYEKNEPIMGGIYLPGIGQATGETLGTSQSLIKAPPTSSVATVEPTVTSSLSGVSPTVSGGTRSSGSGKSQEQLKAEETPNIAKTRSTSRVVEIPVPLQKPGDPTVISVPEPVKTIYPTTGVGLPTPTAAQPITIDVVGGVTSFFKSVASFFGF